MPDREPNGSPEMPIRCFRAPDELWQRVKAKAAKNNETVTSAIIRFLQDYSK